MEKGDGSTGLIISVEDRPIIPLNRPENMDPNWYLIFMEVKDINLTQNYRNSTLSESFSGSVSVEGGDEEYTLLPYLRIEDRSFFLDATFSE